jgi:hypothetical protein
MHRLSQLLHSMHRDFHSEHGILKMDPSRDAAARSQNDVVRCFYCNSAVFRPRRGRIPSCMAGTHSAQHCCAGNCSADKMQLLIYQRDITCTLLHGSCVEPQLPLICCQYSAVAESSSPCMEPPLAANGHCCAAPALAEEKRTASRESSAYSIGSGATYIIYCCATAVTAISVISSCCRCVEIISTATGLEDQTTQACALPVVLASSAELNPPVGRCRSCVWCNLLLITSPVSRDCHGCHTKQSSGATSSRRFSSKATSVHSFDLETERWPSLGPSDCFRVHVGTFLCFALRPRQART